MEEKKMTNKDKTREEYEKDAKQLKTTELFDKLGKEIEDDYEFDTLYSELISRTPFDYIMGDKFSEMEEKMEGMQRAIDKLKRHSHAQNGDVVVQI
ncbi:hypothetical protein HY405_02180 [Candidatus Microgenomates bacterium]|nr:hypothetical protein [Candidatus Microgenomates bacterium]